MSHVWRRIFKFELELSSYWQNIKFSRYCPKFHSFTNIVIFQVYFQLFRPTASFLLILWQGNVRNTLFHFCQLWAVKCYNNSFSVVMNAFWPWQKQNLDFQFLAFPMGYVLRRGVNRKGFDFKLAMVKTYSTWPLLNKYAL